jgi:hypothetical protein
MEDEDYVSQETHMWGNEKEQRMANLEVKTILTSKL